MLVAAKATLLGGAIFLLPAFLAVFVLGKVLGALTSLAAAVGPRLGLTGLLGGALVDAFAVATILLACLAAGLLARRAAAQRMRTKLDQALLASFPGYAFVKGLADNMQHGEEIATGFVPVLVTFDDYSQVAFQTGHASGGTVPVYLPGAPNPWSGNVVLVEVERVRRLPVSAAETLKILRALGTGSEAFASNRRGVNQCP